MMNRLTLAGGLMALLLAFSCSPVANSTVDTGSSSEPLIVQEPGLKISGNLKLKQSLKLKSVLGLKEVTITDPSNEVFTVIATANESGNIYVGQTTADGGFDITIPYEDTNSTFIVTIVAPQGRTVGPVQFGTNTSGGMMGFNLGAGDQLLGAIEIPADPSSNGILATNAPFLDVSSNVVAQLNGTGAPVGLGSLGKGAEAQGGSTSDTNQLQDKDQDGLVDALDADDDGDGTIDDFETDPEAVKKSGLPAGFQAFIVQVLSIQPEQLTNYYNVSADVLSNALVRDMRLELWVYVPTNSGINNSGISSVKLLENPGPGYIQGLPVAAYDLPYQPMEYQNNGRPLFKGGSNYNSMMAAGDSFMFQVNYENGKVRYFTKMLNFVFKNALKIISYGLSNSQTEYSVFDGSGRVNGSPTSPIMIDDNEDVYMTFNPPLDELGQYITNVARWEFQMAYVDTNGQQIGNIDLQKTWTLSERNEIGGGFATGNLYYTINNTMLPPLELGSNYTVRLSRNIFKNEVVVNNGAVTNPVGGYQIGLRTYMNDSYVELNLQTAKKELVPPATSNINITYSGGQIRMNGNVYDNKLVNQVLVSVDGGSFIPVPINFFNQPNSWMYQTPGSTGLTYALNWYATDKSGNHSVTNSTNFTVP